jgi:hypothetical protein
MSEEFDPADYSFVVKRRIQRFDEIGDQWEVIMFCAALTRSSGRSDGLG